MDKIKFVSDLELAIFLFRRFSEKFETRQLVKIAHLPTVSRLEQIIQQKPDWRICENELQDLISNHFLTDELRGAFDNFEFIVAGDRENEWIEEKFELKISKAEENIVENVEDFKEHIDLIGCILSLAIDQKILPTLKKLAADGRLTIFQTLLSYVMKSNIADNYDSTNEVLNEHIHFLRQFDRAIDKIQEQIGNTEGCSKRSLLQSVNIAAQFLLSTDKFSFCSKIRTAQNFLKTHIEEVHRNFKIFNNISSRVCKKPIFISEAQLICYHFLDRLTALDTIEVKQNSVSPNFKTPRAKPTLNFFTSPEAPEDQQDQANIDENQENSDEPMELANFVNNSTPTPIRISRLPKMSIHEELLDEEKENIGPNSKNGKSQDDNNKDGLSNTPKIKPKVFGVRTNSQSNASNSAKPKKIEKPQRTAKRKLNIGSQQKPITSFFSKP